MSYLFDFDNLYLEGSDYITILDSHKIIKILVISSLLFSGASCSALYNSNHHVASAKATAYDISQYQGTLTSHQVKHLKHEVSFVILRAQASTPDWKISHNINLMNKYHIPYGVYSYSYYTSPSVARREARNLYAIAPHAKFYVNDCEENDAGYLLNASTKAWSHTLHHLTHRPVVLYSYLYFMGKFSQSTINTYDTTWIADYGSQPNTSIHYDLWQFADNYYSKALGQRLDADDIPSGYNVKPLSFWIGNHHSNSSKSPIKSVKPASSKVIQRKLVRLTHKSMHLHHHHIHHFAHKVHRHIKISYFYSGHHFIVSNHSGLQAQYHHHHVLIPEFTKLYINHFVRHNHQIVAYAHYKHHLVHFFSNTRFLKHYHYTHKLNHSHKVRHHYVHKHHVKVLVPSHHLSHYLNFGYYQSN